MTGTSLKFMVFVSISILLITINIYMWGASTFIGVRVEVWEVY